MLVHNHYLIIILIVGILSGIGCLVGAFYIYRRKQLIDGLPISKVQGVFIGFYLGALFIGWVWNTFNGLVRLRQRVRQAQSQIEVELKRRYDLVPRIVQIVEAYRRYESGLHQAATELRAQLEVLQGTTEHDIKGALPVLMAVIENYLSLKADGQFANLQHLLTETEQRLALSRDYYNQVSTFYNTRIEVAPDRF
jgi:LemA protein